MTQTERLKEALAFSCEGFFAFGRIAGRINSCFI
jgi:hypothetical protein